MRLKILALLPLVLSGICFAGTCGNSYIYKQHYKLNHALFASDQSDFPVTMCFNGANCATTSQLPQLKTVANGGQVQNTTGSPAKPADLQFCDAASAGNALSYEIEKGSFDAATGKLVVFVKFPTASASSDVDFWVFANNSSVTTSQEDIAGTWSNSFGAVYHFPDGSTLDVTDSLGTNNGTNNSGAATSGRVDGAISLNSATPAYVAVADNASIKPSAMSIEAIVLPASTPIVAMIASKNNGSASDGYDLYLGDGSGSNNQLTCQINGGQSIIRSSVNIGTTDLAYVACTATSSPNSSSNFKEYINGSVISSFQTATYGASSIASNTTALNIGRRPGGTAFAYNGKIDELRISSAVRSADWIAATNSNFRDPRAFIYQVNSCSSCGTVTVVHSTTGTCTGGGGALTSCTISPAWTVTAGNTLIYSVCVVKDVGSAPVFSSVADTLSNTFTAELNTAFVRSGSDSQTCALYRARNITGGTDTSFTATVTSGSGSGSIWTVIALEVSGLQDAVADAAGGVGGAYPLSSGYVPTTNAGDWVVSYGWIFADNAFPLDVGSTAIPACLVSTGTLHTVTGTNGGSSVTMGLTYCSVSATAANHSEWTRGFVSNPDFHNGLVAFPMTPGTPPSAQPVIQIITKVMEDYCGFGTHTKDIDLCWQSPFASYPERYFEEARLSVMPRIIGQPQRSGRASAQ